MDSRARSWLERFRRGGEAALICRSLARYREAPLMGTFGWRGQLNHGRIHEDNMARHIIMDSSGHSTIEFDKTKPSDLAEAERRFQKLIAKGFLAAEEMGGGKHRVLTEGDRTFNPATDETIFIPALKGGRWPTSFCFRRS